MTHQKGHEGSTGAPNLEYDLISTMHNLLEGNAALEKYADDARQAGDREVEDLFRQIHDHNRQTVQNLRDMLVRCMGEGGTGGEMTGGEMGSRQTTGGQSMRGGQTMGGDTSGRTTPRGQSTSGRTTGTRSTGGRSSGGRTSTR